MTLQIQMYWLARKMQEKITKRNRLLKPGFKSNSEITDKRQSIVESIFGELKVIEEIIFSGEYSSSDESDESLSRGNKNSSQNIVQNCMDTRKCMYQGMEIVYFHH